MGILRRLSRWMGTEGDMTKIVADTTAPNFTLKSLDGKVFALARLLEKGPVVAAFFKISCPVCQFTFPFVERLYKRYGGDGVAFVGISQDDAKATKDFAKEYGVTFPMLLDEKSKGYVASNAYGLTSVPTIFLIEPDGTVKTICMGFERDALDSIGRALAERKKMAPTALFRADESVPAHRPG
jgi:peroxiredoxin